MTHTTLQALKEKYPAALYAFFRVTNAHQQFDAVSLNPHAAPQFTYKSFATTEAAKKRLHDLQDDLSKSNDLQATQFLQRRIAETELLLLHLDASERPEIATPEYIEAYRNRQVELYGALDETLYQGIIGFLDVIATKRKNGSSLRRNFHQLIGAPVAGTLYIPKNETFVHYKHVFNQAFPVFNELFEGLTAQSLYSIESVKRIFELALAGIGADKQGWQVVIASHGGNVRVAKAQKQVILPKHMQLQSVVRLRQLVVHEVGCHVYCALHDKNQSYNGHNEIEEGLAIALEQLQYPEFTYRRTMRYLAICLAWGIDGKPRDFLQVYEILTQAFRILGHTVPQAKQRAFNETLRTFRGGIPQIPGMTYIKDKIYLEGNVQAWKMLEKKLPTPEEFKAILAKHDTMQSGK